MNKPKTEPLFNLDLPDIRCKAEACPQIAVREHNLCPSHLKDERQGILGWCRSCNARMKDSRKLGNNCASCARKQNPSVNKRLKERHGPGMILRQNGRCSYCGTEITIEKHPAGNREKPEIDHKTPRSRGGRDEPENIHLTCMQCNRRKGAASHEEYQARIKWQTKMSI